MKINKTQKWTIWLALIILIALLIGVASSAFAALPGYDWAENAIRRHEAWNPNTSNWVTGLPRGYQEGDTAAFLITISGTPGDQLFFHICLDYDNAVTGAFGFNGIAPYNTTVDPDLPFTGFTDNTSDPNVWAYNATIDEVTVVTRGVGGCPSTYLLWEVSFTLVGDGDAYIVYGGILAKTGEVAIIPPPDTIPLGASGVNGVFQARVIYNGGGADRTVNFGSIPTAITLVDFGGSSTNIQWFGLILLAVMLIVTLSIYGVFRLRHSRA